MTDQEGDTVQGLTTKEIKNLARPEFAANPEKFYPTKTFEKLGFSRAKCPVSGNYFWRHTDKKKKPVEILMLRGNIRSLEMASAKKERKSHLLMLGKDSKKVSQQPEFLAQRLIGTRSLLGGEMMSTL